MGRHWKTEGKIVRIIPVRDRGANPWTNPEAYGFDGTKRSRGRLSRIFTPGTIKTLALASVLIGLVVVQGWQRKDSIVAAPAETSQIEWNEVQAVPKRLPDAADVAWEKRGADPGAASSYDDASGAPGDAGVNVSRHSASPERGKSIYAFDGDTFELGGRRIRIANIDAPEIHPPRCAEEARLGNLATEKLRALLNSGPLTLGGTGHDQHGRDLRSVSVNGQDVGEAMISAGVAREYGSGRRSWCG